MMRRSHGSFVLVISYILVCFWAVSVFAQDTKGLPRTVSIATHPKGAIMNIVGGGFAKVITAHLPIQASDRPYTGYSAWMPLLNAGEVDMGITTSPEGDAAYTASGPYKQPLKDLRIISSGSGVSLGYTVRADSGIKTMAELRGKRVAIDRASWVAELEHKTALKAAGLDWNKDVTPIFVAGVAEQMHVIMDGRSDAGWGSVGSSQVKEVASRVGGLRWLSLCSSPDDAAAKLIKETVRGSRMAFFRAGSTPDVQNDCWLVETPIYLVTHKNFSEEAAYQITKTIWLNQKELGAIHPIFKEWTTDVMVSPDAVLVYHPGAIRFYKEAGAWPNTMDQAQKKLLAQ